MPLQQTTEAGNEEAEDTKANDGGERGGGVQHLRWSYLKQHRASVVVGLCLVAVTVLALTVLLPLLLVGTDEV